MTTEQPPKETITGKWSRLFCTPSYFRVTITECTHNDTWRALDGLRAGRIYCEEVHHPPVCQANNPSNSSAVYPESPRDSMVRFASPR